LNCPGYNANVLPQAAHENATVDAATQAQADADAEARAKALALARAWSQFARHLCPPPCISVPILRIVASGFIPVPAQPGATRFASVGWADAQLDVQCIEPPRPPMPLPPPLEPEPATPWWKKAFWRWVEYEIEKARSRRIYGDD
jgi:hypothetical protein